jgi:hypothetical protein
MPPAFRSKNVTDIEISNLVGLETYKALYQLWPSLYSYISDPLTPTQYFVSLVLGVVASSGLSFDVAGTTIRNILVDLVNGETITKENETLIAPLIGSSYSVKNLHSTFWENFIWISVTIFLSFWIIWYLYLVGFWSYIFNGIDGIYCYDCPSVFDKILA